MSAPAQGVTLLASLWWLVSGLSVILTVVPIVAAALAPCAVVYSAFHLAYLRSGVQMQRVFAQSQAPLISLIEESLAGGATIRAFACTERFRTELAKLNDDASTSFLCFTAVGRWLALRLETIGAIISLSVTLACWGLRAHLTGSLTGLAVIWSFNLTISLNFLVLSTSDFESKGVSLERVLQYARLPSEAPLHTPADQALADDWPARGTIAFENVRLRYRPDLPPALDGFTYCCGAGTHTGIIGRSGAGKSTIAAALFRLVELNGGSIRIDGVDIRAVRSWGLILQAPGCPSVPCQYPSATANPDVARSNLLSAARTVAAPWTCGVDHSAGASPGESRSRTTVPTSPPL